MKSAIVVVIVAIGWCVAPSSARCEDKVKARAAYEQATQHYELGEYREALEGFKEAYRQYAEPAFLFNLAQCRRQLGDNAQAIRDYRMYLTKVPDAPNRAEVEAIVERIERASASASPPQDVKPPPVAPAGPPTPTLAAPAPIVAAPAAAGPAQSPVLVASMAPASQRASARKKLIVGFAITGGLVVAGAIVVGVVLGTTPHDPQASLGTFPVQ